MCSTAREISLSASDIAVALRQALMGLGFIDPRGDRGHDELAITMTKDREAIDRSLGGTVTLPRAQVLGIRDTIKRAEAALSESMCQMIEGAKRLRAEKDCVAEVRAELEESLRR